MQKHKFSVGDKVDFSTRTRIAAADGEYEIVRLLPSEGGELQYRIKSARERNERVVVEGDLNPRKGSSRAG
jgi:hypothetical protein